MAISSPITEQAAGAHAGATNTDARYPKIVPTLRMRVSPGTSGTNRERFRTPEYVAWQNMQRRGSGAVHPARYRDRGIGICPAWSSFAVFLRDMGPRPPGLTLDRIDNDRGYEPGNCRWASRTQQNRNQQRNRLICVDGVTHSVAEWAEVSGVNASTIYTRLRRGASAEAALRPAVSK